MNCISDRTGAIRDAFPGSHVSHDPVARLHIAAVSLVIPGYAHQHPHLFTYIGLVNRLPGNIFHGVAHLPPSPHHVRHICN